MALWLVLDHEIAVLPASELGSAGLFGVEVVEARLPGKYFSAFGYLQSLAK